MKNPNVSLETSPRSPWIPAPSNVRGSRTQPSLPDWGIPISLSTLTSNPCPNTVSPGWGVLHLHASHPNMKLPVTNWDGPELGNYQAPLSEQTKTPGSPCHLATKSISGSTRRRTAWPSLLTLNRLLCPHGQPSRPCSCSSLHPKTSQSSDLFLRKTTEWSIQAKQLPFPSLTPLRVRRIRAISLFSHGARHYSTALGARGEVSQPLQHRLQRKQAFAYGGPCYPDIVLREPPRVRQICTCIYSRRKGVLTAAPIKAFGAFMQMAQVPETLLGVWAKSIFTKTLSHHLPFSLSFFHLYIVEFPVITGLGNAIDWMQMIWESSYLSLW